MEEYNLLVNNGNIGIYNSCEVTEIVIMENSKIYNLYTLVVFQEKPVKSEKSQHAKGICNRIEIDDEHEIGIFQYELKLDVIKENFEKLINEYKWISDHKDESSISYSYLRRINKQFVPSIEDNRLNNVLKNNFYAGSYIIEFFDENKHFGFLTDDDENFEKVSNKIQKHIPINLYKLRDRLGNFIFQFPINILNTNTEVASDLWDSLTLNFVWHSLIKDNPPECLLEADSILDKNYIGDIFEEYNKKDSQELSVGNVDSLTNVKIWRKNPKLLIYSHSGYYVRNFGLFMSLDILNKRYFMNDGEKEFVHLQSNVYNPIIKRKEYYQYIEKSIGIEEKIKLEETLSFKQYTPENEKSEGISDLRRLIRENGQDGVYLWDPYLTFEDILNTLFYCPFEGVTLKALGSLNQDVRRIYFSKSIKNKFHDMSEKVNSISPNELSEGDFSNFIASIQEDIDGINEYFTRDNNVDWINEQKTQLSNLDSNFKGLNLEFRVQKGKGAHDRFLIFPGNSKTYQQPKVYSLGTSVNSFGSNYHILQEVLYPQAVLREFNEIWEKSKEGIIWKYPE